MQLQDPVYRYGVYAAAAWYVVGIIYFALVGRHKLVYSPEEEFAVKERQKSMGHANFGPARKGRGRLRAAALFFGLCALLNFTAGTSRRLKKPG